MALPLQGRIGTLTAPSCPGPTVIGRVRLRSLAFLATLNAVPHAGHAQQPATAPQVIEEQTRKNVNAPCLEPPPLVRWEEYRGPFQKIIGTLAGTVERKSVHQPHYKPGTLLCSLEPKDKFFLFIHDSVDPLAFLTAGFNAGIDQARNQDPSFGQGLEGYSKRFGADFADQTSLRFFTDFAYPTIFSEDPRYYRLAHGSVRSRVIHAVSHTFVAHHDDGKHMFNFSEWLGTASAAMLGDAYHPDNQRGLGADASRVGFAILTDMGFDVLREFWPEIARKLRMPFRQSPEPDIRPPAARRSE